MGMTERATATEAEAEQVAKKKLMEDLKAVVAGAEELLKATADQTGERIARRLASPSASWPHAVEPCSWPLERRKQTRVCVERCSIP